MHTMGPRTLTDMTIKHKPIWKVFQLLHSLDLSDPKANNDASTQTSKSTNPKHVSLRGGRRN